MQTCLHEQIGMNLWYTSTSFAFASWSSVSHTSTKSILQNRVDFGDDFGATFPTNDPESLPWHRTCLALYHRRLFYLLPAVYRRQSTWSWGGLTLAHKVITQAASCLGSKLQIWCFVIFSECFQSLRLAKTWTDPLFNIRNPPTNILLLYQGLSIFWMPHTNSKKYMFCQA